MHGGWIRAGLALALADLAAGAAAAGETITYRYDALGRLIATSGEGAETALQYDPAGNRTSYTVALGAGGIGGGGTPGPAVPDGSFEDPPTADWTFGPGVTGVTFTGRAGVQHNGGGWHFANAPQGSQTAVLQGYQGAGGSITFALSGLTPGASYRVGFAMARRPEFGVAPVTVSVDGIAFPPYTPASTAFEQVLTPAFTAGAATATLTFSVVGTTEDTSIAIDAVSLTQLPASPAVADGSFEAPVTANWAFNPDAPGATFAGRSGVQRNGGAWAFAAAPDGSQTGILQGYQGAGGAISLAVTGLTPGATYRFRFAMARRPVFGPAGLTVGYAGTSFGPFTPASTAFEQAVTGNFLAGAANGTLILSIQGTTDDTSIAVDSVTVERVS